jgi:RNA polymerase sigma-70 factor (ECF subfamily)
MNSRLTLLASRRQAGSPAPGTPTEEPPASQAELPRETPSDVSVALDRIVNRFSSLMRRIGRGYRLPDDAIDEAIQDVRIRLWRALATVPDIQRVPATYIHRTTVSAMLDLLRRRAARRETATVSIEGRVTLIPPSSVSSDAGVAQHDVELEVSNAIGTIPETRRAVVRMNLAGYSREEIASLLGWSEAKTRNLLYRGLDDLRQALRARGMGWETKS